MTIVFDYASYKNAHDIKNLIDEINSDRDEFGHEISVKISISIIIAGGVNFIRKLKYLIGDGKILLDNDEDFRTYRSEVSKILKAALQTNKTH